MQKGKEKGLTAKQELFCKEYIIDLNATQAYIRAGYKVKDEKSAGVLGHKMLKNVNIAQKVDELKAQREQKLNIDAEWVLKEAVEVYRIAKGDLPHKMQYNTNGKAVKADVHKTNLKEANRALEIIGKHTSVKAFEKEIDFGDLVLSIDLPDELKE